MNIIIRADGGESIGFGHIMRCLEIAKVLRTYGVSVIFAINNSQSVISKIHQFQFETIVFDDCLSVEEISKLCDIIKKVKPDALIIDSYNVTVQYFSELRSLVKNIIYIDDLNMFPYDVDMVINGNVYADELLYTLPNPAVRFFLGSKYTILRDDFTKVMPIHIKPNATKCLITFGAADPLLLTPKIIDCFIQADLLNKINLDVVIGPAFKNVSEITDKYLKTKNIDFHTNVRFMSKLMARNDIAVTAGGSTVYELAYLGVPSLIITTAKNQFMLAAKMDELGAADYLGYAPDLTEVQIICGIKKLINDYQYRQSLHEKASKMIDGKGSARCADEIVNLIKK